jgi:hypothetical protein
MNRGYILPGWTYVQVMGDAGGCQPDPVPTPADVVAGLPVIEWPGVAE